jgi:thiosulfate/3-mercaptopyruvate sulfurtransferase
MSVRGIGDEIHVVAVDHAGGQFATRLWWALTYYGHEAVSVLDGGMKRWVAEGRPIAGGEVQVARAVFPAHPRREWRATATQVLSTVGRPETQVVDARDEGQFSGARRRGPRGGHIPGAKNLPRELFFAEGGGFRPLEEIGKHVEAHHMTPERPVIAYCNGGVAATVVLFNLYRLGFSALANYDGSWNEWGARDDLPTET